MGPLLSIQMKSSELPKARSDKAIKLQQRLPLGSRGDTAHAMDKAAVPSTGSQQSEADLRVLQGGYCVQQLFASPYSLPGVFRHKCRISNGCAQELKVMEHPVAAGRVNKQLGREALCQGSRGGRANSDELALVQVEGQAKRCCILLDGNKGLAHQGDVPTHNSIIQVKDRERHRCPQLLNQWLDCYCKQ